jgi:hypothetical protein
LQLSNVAAACLVTDLSALLVSPISALESSKGRKGLRDATVVPVASDILVAAYQVGFDSLVVHSNYAQVPCSDPSAVAHADQYNSCD